MVFLLVLEECDYTGSTLHNSSLQFSEEKYFISQKFFEVINEVKKIIETSRYQVKRLKELLPNKKIHDIVINYMLKNGLIFYDEFQLNCNMERTYSKIYRTNRKVVIQNFNTVVVREFYYKIEVPKSIGRAIFNFKGRKARTLHETINLKYLNQDALFEITKNSFSYTLETKLKLPCFTRNEAFWLKKQIDPYIIKLLKDKNNEIFVGSYRIYLNLRKNLKNNGLRNYGIKGFKSVLILLGKKQKAFYRIELNNLHFKNSEICFLKFHNFRIMVNGKRVILNKEVNEYLGKNYSSVRELVWDFISTGLILNGIDIRTTSTPKLVKAECSKLLSQFEPKNNRFIRELKYGGYGKQHLISYGFQNFYNYIDYSETNEFGEKIPEYEIDYVDRGLQLTIDDFADKIEFLMGISCGTSENLPVTSDRRTSKMFEILEEIAPFNILGTNIKNGISQIENNIYESKGLTNSVNLLSVSNYNEFLTIT